MDLLLDTNILIDYFGRRQPYYKDWIKLDAMREIGDARLWVSSESYTEAFFILRKAVDPAALQKAFVESLDFLNVCSVGASEIQRAAERAWTDFEDCVIDVCAENVEADYIITRDKEGFRRSGIPAYSIPEFFAHLEEAYGIVYEIIDTSELFA